jgi:hypothetical protein
MQLDLLTYQLTPEETEVKAECSNLQPIASPPNPHAIAWQEAKATYFLQLMNRFVYGSRCSPEVRKRETSRLFALRAAALEELKRLRDE